MSNELINWVKYLQVTHDIRNTEGRTSASCVGKPRTKRQEMRYNFPNWFKDFITLRVDGPMDPVSAEITNFSQSGIQFKYTGSPPSDAALACTLLSNDLMGKKVNPLCEVKYFVELEGEMVIGAQVVEVSDSSEFNFFMNISNFMNEILSIREEPNQDIFFGNQANHLKKVH